MHSQKSRSEAFKSGPSSVINNVHVPKGKQIIMTLKINTKKLGDWKWWSSNRYNMSTKAYYITSLDAFHNNLSYRILLLVRVPLFLCVYCLERTDNSTVCIHHDYKKSANNINNYTTYISRYLIISLSFNKLRWVSKAEKHHVSRFHSFAVIIS